MTELDIENIRNVATLAWRDTYSSFIPKKIQEKVLIEAYSEEEMNNRLTSSLSLVVEENNEILGYAFFSGDLAVEEVFLESLYVNPIHQGKGVGKLLFFTGLSKYEEPTSISLTVYKGNPNISFYEKQGFSVVKEIQGDFFKHPVVFLLMKKNVVSDPNRLTKDK
ncbi:GNAT family N-acetyltransferase [Rossellomorea aquimaris]|uniref:GNAT family N-acetyltransferase n=1 Tax=Rossellomorea aquimaris TaxID=189382 RepID=UPI003CE9AF3B